MTNLEKYTEVFTRTFDLEAGATNGLKYQDIAAWDSVGHMGLVAELEDTFGIMMDTDDIIDFNSFEKGMEILSEKYNVEF